jgi:hypothetical protein
MELTRIVVCECGVPARVCQGVAENKKQAIVESNKELGGLAQSQSSTAVSAAELMDPIVVQVHDEHEDKLDLFEASFDA